MKEPPKHEAEITHFSMFDIQVCVPDTWTDEQILGFAPICGTTHGWNIRKEGCRDLAGMPERNPCEKRKGFVHIMLDA